MTKAEPTLMIMGLWSNISHNSVIINNLVPQ